MAKGIDWTALIIMAMGGALLYFNSAVKICTGWNIINPLCWAGSLMTHTLMLWGGIILLIVGLIKLIRD